MNATPAVKATVAPRSRSLAGLLLLLGAACAPTRVLSPRLPLRDAERDVRACATLHDPLRNLPNLVAAIDAPLPADGPAAFRLDGPVTVVLLKYPDFDALESAVARVFLWNERPGDALIPADDANGDGRVDAADWSAEMKKLLNGGRIQGVQYSADTIARAFNASARAASPTAPTPAENAWLHALVKEGALTERNGRWTAAARTSAIFTLAHPGLGTLLHELDHALFDANPGFRADIARLWRRLPASDRAALRATLGRVYDASDEEILRREFAGYAREEFASRLFTGVRWREKTGIIRAVRRIEARYWPALQRGCDRHGAPAEETETGGSTSE